MTARKTPLTGTRGRLAAAALGMLAVAAVVLAGGPWLAAARAAGSAPQTAAPARITINKSEAPNVVEFGKDVSIGPRDTADTVVIVGGKVDVAGTVEHAIIAVGGDVVLEPTAVVGTDLSSGDTALVVVGGHLTRDPGATVTGKRFDWVIPVSPSGTGTSGASLRRTGSSSAP